MQNLRVCKVCTPFVSDCGFYIIVCKIQCSLAKSNNVSKPSLASGIIIYQTRELYSNYHSYLVESFVLVRELPETC